MAGKTRTFVEVVEVVAVPMLGPEVGGICYCARCRQAIMPGEHWRRIERLGSLAVGVHDHCYALMLSEGRAPRDSNG